MGLRVEKRALWGGAGKIRYKIRAAKRRATEAAGRKAKRAAKNAKVLDQAKLSNALRGVKGQGSFAGKVPKAMKDVGRKAVSGLKSIFNRISGRGR